jgi:hypothetical protein
MFARLVCVLLLGRWRGMCVRMWCLNAKTFIYVFDIYVFDIYVFDKYVFDVRTFDL